MWSPERRVGSLQRENCRANAAVWGVTLEPENNAASSKAPQMLDESAALQLVGKELVVTNRHEALVTLASRGHREFCRQTSLRF